MSSNETLHMLVVSDINQGYITSIHSALYTHIVTTDEVSVNKCHGRRALQPPDRAILIIRNVSFNTGKLAAAQRLQRMDPGRTNRVRFT